MKSRGRFAALAATLVLLSMLRAIPAVAAEGPSWGVFSTDATGLMYDNDLLLSHSGNSRGPCAGGFDSCPAVDGLTVINTLQPCAAGRSIACIQSVSASLDGKTWFDGEWLGERVPSWPLYAYPARPDLGFGASHGPNLYQFKGLTSDHGNLFEVAPRMQAEAKTGQALQIDNISIRAQAVYKGPQDARGSWLPPKPGLSGDNWLKAQGTCLDGAFITLDCWLNDTQTNPIQFKVALALPSEPDGWVTGRVFRPEVTFARVAKDGLPELVTISGTSLVVPSLSKTYFSFNPDEKAAWDLIGPALGSPWSSDSISRGLSMSPLQMSMFLTGLSKDPSWDRATGMRTEWIANLTWQKRLVQGSNCSKPGFEGFIGSNSLTYQSELPVFNSATQEMRYSVASPHFLPEGSVLSGAYSLLMSEDMARCIWNLSSKVARIELSVTSDDGTSKVSTNTLKLADSLLHFDAAGFTFSKVNLGAKFVSVSGSGKSTPTPTATPQLLMRKTTITCAKGKLIKKVTAEAPKCPAGFKKK